MVPPAATADTRSANDPDTTNEQPRRRMLRNKSTGELFESPAGWSHHPHQQKERTTRAAATQREEVLDPRDILIVGDYKRWRAKPPERRGTWEQFLRAVNNHAKRAGIAVLSVGRGTGKITESIVRSAQARLDKGKRRATCQESKCGRDPGAPCYGRPWVDTRTWYRLGVVERYRRTLDQRRQYTPSQGEGGEVRSATGSPSDHPNTEGEGMGRETAYIAPPRRGAFAGMSRAWIEAMARPLGERLAGGGA